MTACLSAYLELRLCRPRTEKLKVLLSEWPYRGVEYENGQEAAMEEEEGGRSGGTRVGTLKGGPKKVVKPLFYFVTGHDYMYSPLPLLSTSLSPLS